MGGFEQWCHEVALRLQQRGHTVHILTSRHGLDGSVPSERDVTRTLYLQADVHHYRPLDFFLRRAHQERSNRRELQRAISRLNPDLVVVWGMWDLSRNLPHWAEQWMPGRTAYYISSTWPVEADIHEDYWQLPAGHRITEVIWRPVRALALWQLRRTGYPPKLRFEHAVCCSQFVRNTVVQAGVVPASAGVLFGGIDPEPFVHDVSDDIWTPNRPLRLLYFGTLIHQKGVHTAIEALGLLKQRSLVDRVELTILGSGHPDYEASLRSMVARLGIPDRVHFVGQVPRDEVPSWLKRFDVFLFTSSGPEAMARTVMEAMAAGLLVIGSEAGGQVEMLVNEENSLTFQPEDAEVLARHIERVLSSPALLPRLARAGQQMVLDQFTLKRMADEIEMWLTSIVL
jgi:glycosyltransferase involved in cell wall biosynthesis